MSELEERVRELEQQRAAINEQLSPLYDQMTLLGLRAHLHGEFTYADPGWWHMHSCDQAHLDEDDAHAGTKERITAQEKALDYLP